MVNSATQALAKSKEFQDFSAKLSELVLTQERQEVAAVLGSVEPETKQSELEGGEDDLEDSEAKLFGKALDEKTVTVEELSRIVKTIQASGSDRDRAIDSLVHVSPLDVVWHERFSELLDALFLCLQSEPSVSPDVSAKLLPFLGTLMGACRSSGPQKAMEVYTHWLRLLHSLLSRNVSPMICSMGFVTLAEDHEVAMDCEYLMGEEEIREATSGFCLLLTDCVETLISSTASKESAKAVHKGTERLLDSGIIGMWIKGRDLRAGILSFLRSHPAVPLVMTSQLGKVASMAASREEAKTAFSLMVEMQESLVIQAVGEEILVRAEDFWAGLLDSLRSLLSFAATGAKTLDQTTDEVFSSCATLVRYGRVKGDARILKQIADLGVPRENLHAAAWRMNLASLVLGSCDPMMGPEIEATIKPLLACRAQADAEYRGCYLALLEEFSRFLLRSNPHGETWDRSNTTADLVKRALDSEPDPKVAGAFLTKLSRFVCVRAWAIPHFLPLLGEFLCGTVQRGEPLARDCENVFSLLLLKVGFVEYLHGGKVLEKLITCLDATMLARPDQNMLTDRKRLKRTFDLLVFAPRFLTLYSALDEKRFAGLLEGLLLPDFAAEEDRRVQRVKLVRRMVRNPINRELLFGRFGLAAGLRRLLDGTEVQSERRVETETSKLVDTILALGSNNKDAKIDPLPGGLTAERLALTADTFCSKHKVRLFSRNLGKIPLDTISERVPALFVRARGHTAQAEETADGPTVFPSADDPLLELRCERISERIRKDSQRLWNFLELNCCPAETLAFSIIHTRGSGMLSDGEAMLFVAAAAARNGDDETIARLITTLVEERAGPIEIVSPGEVCRRIYCSCCDGMKTKRFVEECIKVIDNAGHVPAVPGESGHAVEMKKSE